MRSKIFIGLFLVCQIITHVGYCQTTMEPPRVDYYPDQWIIDFAPYKGFAEYPSSGLVAFSDFSSNEPIHCYPLHSGHVKGVSDTVSIIVRIENLNAIDFSIGSYQPQTWFMPVIFDVTMNPAEFFPSGDTTILKYSFEGWYEGYGNPVSPPSVLKKNRETPTFELLYYVWNLPKGKSRLLMNPTAYTPAGMQMLVSYVPPVWVTESKSLADTLNAFGACVNRAIEKKDFTAGLSWCDSILARNQFSIPAYILKADIFYKVALNDSLNELAAHDSALAILNRFGDPVLGDSSTWNQTQRVWYNAMLQRETYFRWRVLNVPRWAFWL